MTMIRRGLAALVLALVCAAAVAAPDHDAARSAIRDALAAAAPGLEPGPIEPTPVDGLYSVVVGANVIYATADGRHVLQGELTDIRAGRSLTEALRREVRAQRMATLDESRMVIFEPEGPVEHEVTVFTDIDCGYCRRLHQQIDGYLARGIRVRYLLMPRAGMDSSSYDKAVSVWCADRPREAMTRAKRGESIDRRQCENPVAEHMALAREFGVRATPTLVTDSGVQVSGYRSPADLARLLGDSGGG